jgi:sulfatase maturation enzyme AslB (radical SAM superfamily)
VRAGRQEVFVSFLQPNDALPETRSGTARFELLNRLSEVANPAGLQVLLCKDDRTLDDWQGAQFDLAPCVPMSDFIVPEGLPVETCECVTMVDPFTVNEACSFSCQYCYAGDKARASKKHNSVRGLPVLDNKIR